MIGALAVDPCGIPIRRPHEDHIRRRHPLADESESLSTAPAPRIALIHATRLSMAPIEEAFAARWPEAGRFHLLEEALSADRVHAPAGAASMAARFVALSRYAQMAGADGILYTCSAFGAEIEAARRAVPLPTLKPNEAMLEEALAIGTHIGLVATFEPSLGSIGAELRALAHARGVAIRVEPVFAPDAMAALGHGDAAALSGACPRSAESASSSRWKRPASGQRAANACSIGAIERRVAWMSAMRATAADASALRLRAWSGNALSMVPV
jgi:hypothetical protein